jgi:hypothetical protein
MRLAEFERDGTSFSSSLSREYYLQSAGLKSQLQITPIFNNYRQLFDLETFHELRALPLDEPLGEKYRRFLLDFVASTYLENGVKLRSEAIAQAEATMTIAWDERELTYRAAPVAWANEPDLDQRHELNERWRSAVEHLNPQRAERHRAMHELVPDLECGDYVELWDRLRGLNLARLAGQMADMLASTADLYRDSLRDSLAEHGLTTENAWSADLAYVFRGTEFDSRFPKDALLPTLVATLRGLGFELEEQRNITLDLEPRPAKAPRAFCSPIDIPNDVRLVLQPMGGHQDYDTLLHEAGHAEHYGNVDPALPFGYKWLGDNSVTEGYAFLLNYLSSDPLWLGRLLDFNDSDDYRRFVLFQKLYMLRRYATKLLYEPQLHRATEPEPLATSYTDLFSQHLLVRYFPETYLADVDDSFYAAQYVRAWTFESQFREYLKKEYDEEWFRAPRAGRFIRDLWREGQKYTAEELLKFMGYDDLEPDLMLAEIREVLGR